MKAIHNGAKAEVLLINPVSKGAEQRANDLHPMGINVPVELAYSLAMFYKLKSKLNFQASERENIKIRLYDSLPSIVMYMWDSTAYMSLFQSSGRSEHCPNLEVSMSTLLGRYIANQFEQLWNAPDTIDLDSYMQLCLVPCHSAASDHCWRLFYLTDENHCPQYAATTSRKLVRQIEECKDVTLRVGLQTYISAVHFIQDDNKISQVIKQLQQRYEWDQGGECMEHIGDDPHILYFENIKRI